MNSVEPDILFPAEAFSDRHLGLSDHDRREMLSVIGCSSVDELLDATVPPNIRMRASLALDPAIPETDVLARLRGYFASDVRRTCLIGQGYYGTITPPVIKRNVLENPAWYTSYTPYQAEISQGRLEALLNFQTMVSELTGFELANASLLDEATAISEAVAMAHRMSSSPRSTVLVDADTHPQSLNVLRTRMNPIGIRVKLWEVSEANTTASGDVLEDVFAVVISHPTSSGDVRESDWLRRLLDGMRSQGIVSIAATDLLACALLLPPGQLGFDIAVGSAQRFGVPMGYGGPHAAFIATSAEHARALPGRLVGVSTDTRGRPALRLSLQTREQHIRRERATSNICTAQVLLANMAGFYAAWHGPHGLRRIANRINRLATVFARSLPRTLRLRHEHFFDTVCLEADDARNLATTLRDAGYNVRTLDNDAISVSFDETTTVEVVRSLLEVLGGTFSIDESLQQGSLLASDLRRDDFMTQSVFNRYTTEHEMLRYLRRLADKDLALDRTMIPLGSCTMKLNSTTEMEPVTWTEMADVHPFAPDDETRGYRELIRDLESKLCVITGYDAVSLQPNAGSQGEFAGLLAIRAYHRSRGDDQRTVCLIPSSAHGTNAASAVMAGMSVVVVACDSLGNVDVADLASKVAAAGENLAALMVTYPSTHGVFESSIREICELIHAHGGQVYVDGANMNALVGLAQPGAFGADVSHLNLHKTFCIPHGGGGPGVGPVAVRAHLADFLPGHPLASDSAVGPVSAAPHGSAGILGIPWVYIAMMGADGLVAATGDAILSANYIAKRLNEHFPVLYSGANGTVAHECILDIRDITRDTGVTVDDIAKRLMDFCFHAPTMSFPVNGTLMVEPTESESLAELNRFVEAMRHISAEIDEIRSGRLVVADSALRHAPHTVEDVADDDWSRSYSRSTALFPQPMLRSRSYFVPVSRIDAAQGDRHLVCTCAPIEAYAQSLGDTV